jgi:DNA-binding transcriptional regulator YiaG
MDQAARQLRRAIAKLGRRRGRPEQIPAAIRNGVLKYMRQHRGNGVNRNGLARAVGVSVTTLKRWENTAAEREQPRALVPVAVRVPPGGAERQLALITPGGVRLEGLGVEEAAWLLRELS